MKVMFISDIHGMSSTLKQALEHASSMHADRIVILGDLLYHGPRNGVPDLYNPTETVDLLNSVKNKILAVRGNCDAEVDQMLLHFPIMADYSELLYGETRFFLTHGHLWNEHNLPDLPGNAVLVHGHTHIAELKKLPSGLVIFNPGSISLPKTTTIRSFGFFDGEQLSVRELNTGKIMMQI